MPHPLLAAFLSLLSQGPPTTQDDPARVVWLATRAVEGDSAAAVETRWRERLRRDPGDRPARLGVATIARLTYDYATAEREYGRLLAATAAPDRYAAHARLGFAMGHRIRGRWREAVAEFTRAVADARAAQDSAVHAEALTHLGVTRMRTDGVPVAESLFARAEPVIPAGDARVQAFFRCARASALAILGRAENRALAEAGAALARRAGEPRFVAACLHIVAQDHWRRGDVDSAAAVWDEAAALQRTARDYAGLAASLQWRGTAVRSAGAYGEAMQNLREAIRAGERSGNLSPVAWAYVGLAWAHLRVGDLATGAAYAARCAALFEEQGDRLGLAQVHALEGDLARARGDPVAARAAYTEGRTLNERAGNTIAVLSLHATLAEVAMDLREWAEAERALAAAGRVARERGMTGWDEGLDQQRALLALRRGDASRAESLLTVVLSRPEQPVRVYRARLMLAEVHARQQRFQAVEQVLVAATDALDRWRATLTAREFRVYAFQVQEFLGDPDLGWATVIAALASNGREAVAFELAERRRARDLLDALARADALRSGGSPGRVASEAERRTSSPTTLAALQAALPDDRTALVAYVTGRGGEPTTAFVVTRDALTARVVPPIDSLSDDVARFVALVETGTYPRALARALGAALLGPAVARLPARVGRLLVVADDVLHRLPFDALMLDTVPAVERYAIGMAPSATVAASLWSRSRPPAEVSVLAMGDPRFPGPDRTAPELREAYRPLFGDGAALPRLAGSVDEVRAIARHIPATELRLGADASEALLKRESLDRYRVLHVATHALVDDRTPARTAIALADGDGEDGFVGPGDLAALRLDADLVVLSACRTAGGVVIRGEGVQGLTAPLLAAGARAVAATLWRVPDRATAPFVDGLYRRLAAGVPVGDALRATKLEALRRRRPVNEWAAFTVVGDPFVTLAR